MDEFGSYIRAWTNNQGLAHEGGTHDSQKPVDTSEPGENPLAGFVMREMKKILEVVDNEEGEPKRKLKGKISGESHMHRTSMVGVGGGVRELTTQAWGLTEQMLESIVGAPANFSFLGPELKPNNHFCRGMYWSTPTFSVSADPLHTLVETTSSMKFRVATIELSSLFKSWGFIVGGLNESLHAECVVTIHKVEESTESWEFRLITRGFNNKEQSEQRVKVFKALDENRHFDGGGGEGHSVMGYLLYRKEEKYYDDIYWRGGFYFAGHWLEILPIHINNMEKYWEIERMLCRLRRRHAEKVCESYDQTYHEHVEKRKRGLRFRNVQSYSSSPKCTIKSLRVMIMIDEEVVDAENDLNTQPNGRNIRAANFVIRRIKEAGFEPGIVVYNFMFSGNAQMGKINNVSELLNEKRKMGSEPKANSYTFLMQMLGGKTKIEQTMRVLIEIEMSGCETDVVPHTTLTSRFCERGEIGRVCEVLEGMIQKRFMPNHLTYGQIILVHEKKEEFEEWVELMGKIGYVSDASNFKVVIRLVCKIGELKEAVNIWIETEDSAFTPGINSFVIMINGFLGYGCYIKTGEYFKKVIGIDHLFTPQNNTLKELNSLFRNQKLGMVKDASNCSITNGFVIPQSNIFAKPLTELLKKGKFDWNRDAQQAFVELKRQLTSVLVLKTFDFLKEFESECGTPGRIKYKRDQQVLSCLIKWWDKSVEKTTWEDHEVIRQPLPEFRLGDKSNFFGGRQC